MTVETLRYNLPSVYGAAYFSIFQFSIINLINESVKKLSRQDKAEL